VLLLGSHVSLKGEDQFLGSVKEALSYGANTFMVYTGAPQNTFRKPIEEMRIDEALILMKLHGINPCTVIVHAPYIVNLANPDPKKQQFAIDFLTEEVKRTQAMGSKIMVLHPGAHMLDGLDLGVFRIASGINQIMKNTISSDITIALEDLAGKGTEIGRNFQELASIISLVTDKSRIGICLDTCHLHDAGYDIVNHFEEVIADFEHSVGMKYLKVIHVNDSKNEIASHKDRHENIGRGFIGFDPLNLIVHHPKFTSIPKILETPYIPSLKINNKSYPPYQFEIEMLKSQTNNPEFIQQLLNRQE